MADRRTNSNPALTEKNLFTRRSGSHADKANEGIPGLYLRVSEAGGRYWVYRFMLDGKRRDMGLGSLADIRTLEDARDAAREARRMKRAGVDPLDVRHRETNKRVAREKWTFRKTAVAVHETLKPSWKNAKHADQWINTLETYAFPTIGDQAAGEVTVADVLAVLKPIWQDKAETARRVRQRIDQVMRWAEAHGHAEKNPVPAAVELLPKQRAKIKHHAALPYEQVPALIARMHALATTGGTLALELVILTAARSGEVRGATWEEIDLTNAVWTIPAERMKADREHRVPLSKAALGTLRRAQKTFGGEGLIFPSARNKPLSDMTLTAALRRWKVPCTAHGFRSSFRDWCAETGVRPELAERCLAHSVKDQTEAAYHRTDQLEQRRPVMRDWAKHLTAGSDE